MIDDFIGQKFGKDEQVEVVGWDGSRYSSVSRSTGIKLYTVKCYKCCNDHELFGDGLFKATKISLKNGKLPCGCTRIGKWTEAQNIIRIGRVCRERGYIFNGFVGDYSGGDTYLKLKCLHDGNEWESTAINQLVLSGRGCPHCSGGGSLKPDYVMVGRFMKSGAFREGTKFWRGDRRNSRGDKAYWKYSCPVCSIDEYVKENLCSGEFEGTSNDLQAGHISCRCSVSFRWTKEQREYQIRKAVATEGRGYTYIGISKVYKDSNSKIDILCAEHGTFSTPISQFINMGHRCPSCTQSGFTPTKDASVYVIKVEGSSGDFTGYGISNVVESRLIAHRCNLKKKNFLITNTVVFDMQGQKALDIENMIKFSFPLNRQEVTGFRTEATYVDLFDDVVRLVEQQSQL